MRQQIQSEYKKPQNEWWNKECRMVIEEENLARMKRLNRRTRINQNNYKQKRTIANHVCSKKKKKKEWLNDKIKQIEEASKKNETRKFYKDSAFFNKQQPHIIPQCKDNKGEIVSERASVLENWRQYFNNLLNLETNTVKSNTDVLLQEQDEEEIEVPTYEEINNIILKLKKK